jgi:hypothetical protein
MESYKVLQCPYFGKFSVNHRNRFSELSINTSLVLKLVSLTDVVKHRGNMDRLI